MSSGLWSLDFPIELQEAIIDLLARQDGKTLSKESREALRNFSLVSPRWLARSRKWLFDKFDVIVYGGAESRPRWKTTRLIGLLQSPHSRIAPYIQSITIHGPDMHYQHTGLTQGTPEQYVDFNGVLKAVLPHLCHVNALGFILVTWSILSDHVKNQILSMSQVTSLSWKYIPQSTFSDVFALTCKTWGTRLQSLDVDWIYSEAKAAPVPLLTVDLPHLHTLRVGARLDRAPGYALLSLESFRMMPSLRVLAIRTFEEDTLLLLRRTRYLGPNLLHFEMHIPVFWSCDISDKNFPFPVNLHYNPNLITLRFSQPVCLGRHAWFVNKMVGTSSSPILFVHIIVSARSTQQELEACNPSELDNGLISADACRRRILHVHPDSTPSPWYKAMIHKLLPNLSRHGYLVVHRTPVSPG